MKQTTHRLLISGAGLLAMALSAPGYAAVSWNFSGSGQNANNSTMLGSDGTTTTTIKGYSSTGDVTGEDTIETVQSVIRWGGGLGVCSNDDNCGSSGPHATDNYGDSEVGADTDMILFSFNKAIDLDTVSVGWWEDSDITILAYTGAGIPGSLVGGLYSALPSGWSFIGNYADVAAEAGHTVSVNAANVVASHWLIGAYNPLIKSEGWSTQNDAIKISAISGSISDHSVPEPASLALMGIGLTAFGFTRRKKQA